MYRQFNVNDLREKLDGWSKIVKGKETARLLFPFGLREYKKIEASLNGLEDARK